MDQGRAEACRITLGQTNLVRVSRTVLPMLRAASLLEAGLHLLQRSRQVSPLQAYSDRPSACLAKGRLPDGRFR